MRGSAPHEGSLRITLHGFIYKGRAWAGVLFWGGRRHKDGEGGLGKAEGSGAQGRQMITGSLTRKRPAG